IIINTTYGVYNNQHPIMNESGNEMEYVLFIIAAYILGSIPTGLIVGKIGFKIDIREHGSGNLGATNSFRVMGMKAGIIVILVDILKGTAATLLPLFVEADIHRLVIGLFAVL